MVGNFEWKGPNDTFDRHFTTAGLDLTQKRVAKYLDLCERLQDMPRHLSQHSGGMVICSGRSRFGRAARTGNDAGARCRAVGQR